jgi:hypothetical protein
LAELFPTSHPKQINQRAKRENYDPYSGIQRRGDESANDETPAGQYKYSRRVRMPRDPNKIASPIRTFSAPKNKQSHSSQSEEECIDCYNIVKDLIVFPGQRDDHGPDALQDDRDNRDARPLAYPANRFEENAVARHCVVNPGRGENALGEKSDG